MRNEERAVLALMRIILNTNYDYGIAGLLSCASTFRKLFITRVPSLERVGCSALVRGSILLIIEVLHLAVWKSDHHKRRWVDPVLRNSNPLLALGKQ